MKYLCLGKNKIDFLEKIRFKEKDLITIMGSIFYDYENRRNDYWRGRSEVQSNWDKKYILKYKPEKSI